MKISVKFLPGVVVAATALIIGCGGGSGSSTSSGAPAGKSALHYGVLSSYHSVAAGMAFPNKVLRMVAPSSSGIGASPVIPLDLASLTSYSKGSRTVDYDPILNLYFSEAETANSVIVSYYTDATESVSAGMLSVSTTGSSLIPTLFPATISGKVNLTAGNIPMTGTCQIVMSSATGSNQLTGIISLPKDGVTLRANMTLSSTLQVSGTATITENGQTLAATQIAGQLDQTLTCNATLQPGNYSGTGTLNFPNQTMSLNLTSGSQTVQGTVNSSGALVLTYSDGTTETVTDPITAKVSGGNGSSTSGSSTSGSASSGSTTSGSTTSGSTTAGSSAGTGGTSGFTAYTVSRMPSAPTQIVSVAPAGQMVGTSAAGVLSYWPTPTSQPQPISPDTKLSSLAVVAVNSKGHILADGIDPSTLDVVPLYYSSPTSAPVPFPELTGTKIQSLVNLLINSNDQITVSGFSAARYYSSPTSQTPITPNDPVADVVGLIGLSDVGTMLGYDGAEATQLWKSLPPTGLPVELGQYSRYALMGANGTVAVNYADGNGVVKIAAPSAYSLTTLTSPSGATGNLANGVGPSGNILGYSYVSVGTEGVLWKSPSAPTVFGTQGTITITSLLYQTTSGVIVALGSDRQSPAYNGYFLLTPK